MMPGKRLLSATLQQKQIMHQKPKYAPSTLYLLSGNQYQDDKKNSARPSLTNKKANRSITQLSKYAKQSLSPLRKHQRTESSVKKLVLSKQKYHNECLTLTDKIALTNSLFMKSFTTSFSNDETNGETAFKMTHLTQPPNNEPSMEEALKTLDKKFQGYEKMTESWKEKAHFDDIDSSIETLINNFKGIVAEICQAFTSEISRVIENNHQQTQAFIVNYQLQFAKMHRQSIEISELKHTISELQNELSFHRQKGQFVSCVFEEMQKKGIDVEEWILNSQSFQREVQMIDEPNQIKARAYLNEFNEKEPDESKPRVLKSVR